jgi:adenine/guanine phosphoribosyltransferase-like PRPP-binding protein
MPLREEGLSSEGYLHLFREAGALLTDGHYVLGNKHHTGTYIAKYNLASYAGIIVSLAQALASRFIAMPINVVVTPGGCASILGHGVALHHGHSARSVFATEVEGRFVLDPDFAEIVRGTACLVVDDVTTKGATLRRLSDATRQAGGEVLGAGCLWNRGGATAEGVGAPKLESLLSIQLDDWAATLEEPCPLCTRVVPITPSPGHGAEFLARQRA